MERPGCGRGAGAWRRCLPGFCHRQGIFGLFACFVCCFSPKLCPLCVCWLSLCFGLLRTGTMGGGKSVKARRRVGCKGKPPGRVFGAQDTWHPRGKVSSLILTIKRSLRTIPAQIGSTAGVFCNEENEFTLGINDRGGIYGC